LQLFFTKSDESIWQEWRDRIAVEDEPDLNLLITLSIGRQFVLNAKLVYYRKNSQVKFVIRSSVSQDNEQLRSKFRRWKGRGLRSNWNKNAFDRFKSITSSLGKTNSVHLKVFSHIMFLNLEPDMFILVV
jgi:hypothetical protein